MVHSGKGKKEVAEELEINLNSVRYYTKDIILLHHYSEETKKEIRDKVKEYRNKEKIARMI